MITESTIDVTSERMARRLAAIITDRRRQAGLSVRAMSRMSRGSFTTNELKLIEAAGRPLTVELAEAIGRLYDVDLAAISVDRLQLVIQTNGVVSTGGHATSFDPGQVDSLLSNFLRLIRTMRGDERSPLVELRRGDVETLSEYLELSGELVVERLARLMGATRQQRRALAGTFLAGAMVISLSGVGAANVAGASVHAFSDDTGGSSTTSTSEPIVAVGTPPVPDSLP